MSEASKSRHSPGVVVDPPTHSSPLPRRIPDHCRDAALRHLEESSDLFYWIVLDSDWRITAVSDGFQREVLDVQGPTDGTFLSTLAPTLACDVRDRHTNSVLEGEVIELVHPVKSGTRAVAYRFYGVDGGWLLFGRDQSRQIELVSQMSVLLEDMELEMRKERDAAGRLRALLSNDELTGLANRRRFQEVLRTAWNSFVASEQHFAVISLDIDHFKQVNDRFGHAVGDEVLKRVAKALEASIRGEDTVARCGGEEFLVLASGARDEGAVVLAERIRHRIELTPMPGGVGSVTVSLGVASTDMRVVEGASEMLSRSDLALYTAKAKGRNRVESATALGSTETVAPEGSD